MLRAATGADLPALTAIEAECFTDPSWSSEDFLKYDCTVAEISGYIAGFVVSRQTAAASDGNPAEREILNLAVSRSFRRTGVATRLLSHELARGAACFLEVRESNLAAQALYRKIGFTSVGHRQNYYRHPVESAIVMQMK